MSWISRKLKNIASGRPTSFEEIGAQLGVPTTASNDHARGADWRDALNVVRALERHKVEYVLVGGYALNFNGVVRQTGDVDILVADNPSNNAAWIQALSEIFPDLAADLAKEAEAPFVDSTSPDHDDELGIFRIIGDFVVDVMPKACGRALSDLAPHIRRVRQEGQPINVLDLAGLKLTKLGARAKDKLDLAAIDSALAALQGQEAEHTVSM